MSRSLFAAIGLCTGLLCVLAPEVTSHAQWAQWEIGSGPWGGMRYRGPLLSIDIGGTAPPPAANPYAYGLVPAPVPPWHYRHDRPQATQAMKDQERFYHDLDRTHRYRTREERYADDFRDRYASGDPFYHSYRQPTAPSLARAAAERTAPIPGLSYGPPSAQRRSFVADAEVADLLRPAATRLINSLSRKRDGAVWMKHLQPDRIIDAIDRAEFPGSLSDLVEHYDGVVQNPRLVLIAEAEGFRDTHRLLSQYVLLQSRFAAVEAADSEYEVFMGADQQVMIDGAVVTESQPPAVELNPAAPFNPAEQATPADAEAIPEEEIQYLPAPAGEPDTQP